MIIAELLARLRAADVRLVVEGEELRVSAPPGALSEELRAALASQKASLIEALRGVGAVAGPPLRARTRGPAIPLSFAQERLWFLAQLDPTAPVYHIPVAFRLTGPLDLSAFEGALRSLIRRHEALRTTFPTANGSPVQRVASPDSCPVDFQAVSAVSEDGVADELAAHAAHPLDLAAGPLLRVRVFRLGSQDHVVLFVLHHIVFDWWSLGVFLRELSASYSAHIGAGAEVPPPVLQYADFSEWQREWLRGERLERHLTYWRSHLGGDVPPLELPADRPRPRILTYRGGGERFTLPAALIKELTTLGAADGATLFMVLLAGFRALLQRYSGQDDFAIGTDVAGRPREELESVIGYFANTLALRSRIAGSLTLRELIQKEREVCLGAFSHQDVPFVSLVEALQPERDPGRTPFAQVMLIMLPATVSTWTLGPLRATPVNVRLDVARTDLSIFLHSSGGDIAGVVEYSSDLFDPETIRRFIAHYRTLLGEMAARPETALQAVPLLDSTERRRVLLDWNDSQRPYPSRATIHELVTEQAGRTPDAVALVSQHSSLTYGQLESRANLLAHRLRALGASRGQLIGLCTDRSPDMVVGALGILKAGGAYVPLDPAYPVDRLRFMVDDAGLDLVVTQTPLLERLPRGGTRLWCLDEASPGLGHQPDAPVAGTCGAEDLVYVIYTSGSTGMPKGVEVTHRSLVNCLWSLRDVPGMSANDVVLAVSTLSFDIATAELLLPLLVGARVVLASRDDLADVAALKRLLEIHGVTVMQGTPATWRMLIDGGWTGRSGFRAWCGGEALSPDLASALAGCADCVWNLYGPTEATVWATVKEVRSETRRITIGRPIANTRAYVLDQRGEPVPIGVPGELYLGGHGIARGYLRRPQLTAERFVPDRFGSEPGGHLYRTGDVVRWLPDGELEFLGRTDDQVKVRGYRIELGELEAALKRNPGIRQAAAAVRESRGGDSRLVAYVVFEPGYQATPSDLRRALREILPDYMIPQHIVEIDALPLTANGKLDRRALPAPLGHGHGGYGEDFRAPSTPAERLVADVWREVLDVERVSAHENFFDAGGHSLLSIRALHLLRERTGCELPPRIMLLETLGQIAARLNGSRVEATGGTAARSP